MRKLNENEEMIVAVKRNLCNCVKKTGKNSGLQRRSNPVEVLNFFSHCDDHFFIFISFPQFIYDLFHISLTHLGVYVTVYLLSLFPVDHLRAREDKGDR